MFDQTVLNYTKGNDCLQTRVRHPRTVMPNFAFYCDWIIWDEDNIFVDEPRQPRIIYVRSEITALNFFKENVLSRFNRDFVLVTTCHDTPMPLGFEKFFDFRWKDIISNRHLRAWFTENRDLVHEKIRPIPLGIPFPDLPSWLAGTNSSTVWTDDFAALADSWKHASRIPKIFGCWYPRVNHPSGTCPEEDNERQNAYDTFINRKELFDWHEPGMDRNNFIAAMGRYRFVLCPHGGGLDPNPKCWEALIMGAIPIVRRNSMSEALEHLPLVVVDEWTEITREMLDHWEARHAPALEAENLRHLMSNEYFYRKMEACLD